MNTLQPGNRSPGVREVLTVTDLGGEVLWCRYFLYKDPVRFRPVGRSTARWLVGMAPTIRPPLGSHHHNVDDEVM